MRNRGNKGFTLIEIMISVAVLAILVIMISINVKPLFPRFLIWALKIGRAHV